MGRFFFLFVQFCPSPLSLSSAEEKVRQLQSSTCPPLLPCLEGFHAATELMKQSCQGPSMREKGAKASQNMGTLRRLWSLCLSKSIVTLRRHSMCGAEGEFPRRKNTKANHVRWSC